MRIDFAKELLVVPVVAAQIASPAPVAVALDQAEVENIARAIAVKINRPKSIGAGWIAEGSGVIIGRDGDTYYALTAAHVVRQENPYQIETADGEIYRVDYGAIVALDGVDLAILPFVSSNNYPVATLGNSARLREDSPIYVFGWPKPGRKALFTAGQIINARYVPQEVADSEGRGSLGDDPLDGGYSLAYKTEQTTEAGMSGGPILDLRGELVGIHRRAPLWPGLLGVPSEIISSRVARAIRDFRSIAAATPEPIPNVTPLAADRFALANTFREHSMAVDSIAVSSDGQTLVGGSYETRRIERWNWQSGKRDNDLSGHTGRVRSVAISPDGQFLVSGSYDKTIKVWNLRSGKMLHTLEGHSDWVLSVAISPDGQTIASGSLDKTIKIWDLNGGQLLRTLPGHELAVSSLSFSPNGPTLASGSHDNTVKIWNYRTGQMLRLLEGHSARIWSIAISPNGQILASGSEDKTTIIWNLNTHQPLRTLKGHSDAVFSVAIAPDGQTLASGSKDKTIKVWNLRTGNIIRTLTDPSDTVRFVAFSPNGQTIIGGTSDRKIMFWRLGS